MCACVLPVHPMQDTRGCARLPYHAYSLPATLQVSALSVRCPDIEQVSDRHLEHLLVSAALQACTSITVSSAVLSCRAALKAYTFRVR